MFKNVISKISMICVAATMATLPTNVSADEIALTFKQHDLTLVGDYLGFEDNAFVIETEIGVINVPAEMVSCVGADCANTERLITISG